MLVKELKEILEDSSMQDRNLNVKLIKDNPVGRVTIADVLVAVNALSNRVAMLAKRIDEVEASINARIDNLVAKNNLKE